MGLGKRLKESVPPAEQLRSKAQNRLALGGAGMSAVGAETMARQGRPRVSGDAAARAAREADSGKPQFMEGPGEIIVPDAAPPLGAVAIEQPRGDVLPA